MNDHMNFKLVATVPGSAASPFAILIGMTLLRLIHSLLIFVGPILAHGHHENPTKETAGAPIDRILWIHMFLQAAVWGVLLPVGMVLGMSRSRWHVPLQVFLASCLPCYTDVCVTDCGHSTLCGWYLPRTCPRWSSVSAFCASVSWEHYLHSTLVSTLGRHLP
jgi:hypothetical protein